MVEPSFGLIDIESFDLIDVGERLVLVHSVRHDFMKGVAVEDCIEPRRKMSELLDTNVFKYALSQR